MGNGEERRDRKTSNEGAEVTCWGKPLQIEAAETGKARSSTVDWIVECGRRSGMKTRQNGVADEPRRPPLDTAQFIDEVRRCRPVKAFVHEDGTNFESNPLRSLQPVELAEERSDVVEPRRRKDEPSSGIHH